jgi:hypothetical protein
MSAPRRKDAAGDAFEPASRHPIKTNSGNRNALPAMGVPE